MLEEIFKDLLRNAVNEVYKKEKIDKSLYDKLNIAIDYFNNRVYADYDYNLFIKNNQNFVYNNVAKEIKNQTNEDQYLNTNEILLKNVRIYDIIIRSDFVLTDLLYSFDGINWFRKSKNENIYVNNKIFLRILIPSQKKIEGLILLYNL